MSYCKNGSTDQDAVWDVDFDESTKHVFDGGAHWRHLANMTRTIHVRRWCGLTSNYFDHLLTDYNWPSLEVFLTGLFCCWSCRSSPHGYKQTSQINQLLSATTSKNKHEVSKVCNTRRPASTDG